jgi:hypothetical protein
MNTAPKLTEGVFKRGRDSHAELEDRRLSEARFWTVMTLKRDALEMN